MKKIVTVFFLLIAFNSISAQVKLEGIGLYGGLGTIKGNSAGVASFTTSAFIDTKMFFSEFVIFRYSFFYARKFEALIASNSRAQYFPFHKGYSIKAVIEQPLSEYVFLEEGAGFLFLNDRTFSDTNEWGIGITFHLVGGLDFRDDLGSGFKVGVGSEVGTTFTETTPQFFSAHIQTAYYF